MKKIIAILLTLASFQSFAQENTVSTSTVWECSNGDGSTSSSTPQIKLIQLQANHDAQKIGGGTWRQNLIWLNHTTFTAGNSPAQSKMAFFLDPIIQMNTTDPVTKSKCLSLLAGVNNARGNFRICINRDGDNFKGVLTANHGDIKISNVTLNCEVQ